MPTTISIRGLGKSYGTGESVVHALRDVDLDLASRRLTVILGPSGSGKSTLLNLLGGMDRASAGSLVVDGMDITAFDDRQLTDYRRRSVGFVFQFYNLVPNLTAHENVALAAGLVADRPGAHARAEELLTEVGLGHRLDNFPDQLSGGEMQRVAIARALSKRPALLLCDEPTGALDTATGERVIELLRGAATDTAVLLVTHNPELAGIADHLIRLSDGRVVESSVRGPGGEQAEP
ncbi:ABC transporter ATP-binding protein [Propioniciclava sp. MC1683]|uniref:ABC transporter ATP-binding protein n=1 Tax=Propioniciclava sp. MC1683 TaxID=2760309 RepID=UPI0015FFFC3E|nr:ABC transporter ATP-binding protein [Propioniciclava sp. MC1683]MBB1499839.1 ABC transporter ATP-binding protein [Propioniciclava sp. MC1683]